MTETRDPLVARIGEGEPGVWDDAQRGRISFFSLFNEAASSGRKLTSGLAVLEPRTGFLRPHRHVQPEVYFIISGEGIVTLGEQEMTLGPNHAVYIPSNARHGARNEGEEELRIFYVLAADSFDAVEYHFDDEGSR